MLTYTHAYKLQLRPPDPYDCGPFPWPPLQPIRKMCPYPASQGRGARGGSRMPAGRARAPRDAALSPHPTNSTFTSISTFIDMYIYLHSQQCFSCFFVSAISSDAIPSHTADIIIIAIHENRYDTVCLFVS